MLEITHAVKPFSNRAAAALKFQLLARQLPISPIDTTAKQSNFGLQAVEDRLNWSKSRKQARVHHVRQHKKHLNTFSRPKSIATTNKIQHQCRPASTASNLQTIPDPKSAVRPPSKVFPVMKRSTVVKPATTNAANAQPPTQPRLVALEPSSSDQLEAYMELPLLTIRGSKYKLPARLYETKALASTSFRDLYYRYEHLAPKKGISTAQQLKPNRLEQSAIAQPSASQDSSSFRQIHEAPIASPPQTAPPGFNTASLAWAKKSGNYEHMLAVINSDMPAWRKQIVLWTHRYKTVTWIILGLMVFALIKSISVLIGRFSKFQSAHAVKEATVVNAKDAVSIMLLSERERELLSPGDE